MAKAIYNIVGMKHRGTVEVVRAMTTGTPLHLIREPKNAHDPFAVQVWTVGTDPQHVAYIKATEAPALSKYIERNGHDGGAYVDAKFVAEQWPKAEVDE